MSHPITRYTLARYLLSIALILALPLTASATARTTNGEVVIGEERTGPSLDTLTLPEAPLLVVIDSPYEAFSETGTLIHVAAWKVDGAPAAGAEVYFADELIGTADATGTLVFRWGVPGDDRVWSRGGDVVVRLSHHRLPNPPHHGVLYGGQVSFNAHPRTSSFSSTHVFVYTDRATYNPGDEIHIRTLGWNLREDYSPLRDENVEFLLTDPEGRIVGGGEATTSDLGVCSLDLSLAEHATEGVYELRATHGDASARARLRVKRFTPPIIDIQHDLGRFLTAGQDALEFTLELGYFTDADFISGTVAVDLLVEGTSRFHQSEAITGPGPHPVAIGSSTLSEVRRGLAEGDHVEVQIVVTDQDGRSDELLRELRYTRNPYVVTIEKDRDYYSPGDQVELIVRIVDLDRVPVRETEVTALVDGVPRDGMTDGAGTVQFSFRMPTHEPRVEILLADVGNAVATATIALQGSQPMRSHIADAVVLENESVDIEITFPSGFVPAESVVHVDVVDYSGSLVRSALIPISERSGVYVAEGSFSSPSWGSMLLTLFCLGSETGTSGPVPPTYSALGVMTEGQNLAVHPNRQLSIHLDGIPDHLAPGADYSGTITVSDQNGDPVDAAVGAAVVDAAIISMGSPLEITPMDYFYNPQLRVISTTGSAILTWPVVSRNWGPNQRDIALPPFPFRPGGAVSGDFAEGPKAEHSLGEPEFFGDHDAESDSYGIGDYAAERPLAELADAASLITIRTEFPDTSLWAPNLFASEGSTTLSGTMPDTITTQEIAIVASDANGGVGVLRVPIRVTQPLYVMVDIPDQLTVGDQLQARVLVQNTTDSAQDVEVAFISEGLGTSGAASRLEVPANGSAFAVFPIDALSAGTANFSAIARGDDFQDSTMRQVWVRPVGEPSVSVQDLSDTSAVAEIVIPADGQMSNLTLNVAFPAVTTAFLGLEAIRSDLASDDMMGLGGELIASTLIYNMLVDQGADHARIEYYRKELQWSLYHLLSYQQADGGWSFWWNHKSDPYTTAYCLEALVAGNDAGLAIPRAAFRDAAVFLRNALAADGLYDMSAIAFWEGNAEQVRLGLTAEIFDILTSVPTRGRNPEWRETIELLAPTFIAYLDSANPDLKTLAHAALGLHRVAEEEVLEVERDRIVSAARQLLERRRLTHWEPSWFNAYGGSIEATVVALRLYNELGEAELLASEQREAVRYLLSTRDEWGGWHNPRGTAAAIRGLALLELEREESPANFVVFVDETEVTRVAIDPDDPFQSTLSLRSLDLSEFIEEGTAHQIRVEYDGSLSPDVRVIARHWGRAEAALTDSPAIEPALSATTVEVDGVVRLDLTVSTLDAEPRLLQVDVAPPSNCELEEQSLASLQERGLIESYEPRDSGYRLVLEARRDSAAELAIRLRARRPGESVVPPLRVETLGGNSSHATTVAINQTLAVR